MSEGAHLGAPQRGDWPWLASLLLVGCLTLAIFACTAQRLTGGPAGVPLDDAWIHFHFARNLARGDGFSFNPDQPTAGSTAPLWTLLLAGVYVAGGRFPVAGQLLSGACFLATLAVTYTLGLRLTSRRWTAWLASMVVAVNGRMVWAGLSGLETCLFAALGLLAIGSYLGDRGSLRQAQGRLLRQAQGEAEGGAPCYRLRTAALFGLAALSRPEGYLLFALSLVDFALRIARCVLRVPCYETRNTKHETRLAHHISRIVPPALLFAAIVLPYLIFSWRTGGHLLPNTYHAKVVFDFRPDLDFLSLAARYLILDNPLLLPFYVLGLAALFIWAVAGTAPTAWQGRGLPLSALRPLMGHGPGHVEEVCPEPVEGATLLGLWSAGLPLVYAFLHAVLYQHGRYLIPLVPCHALVSVLGLLGARRWAVQRGYRWRGSPTALVILVSLLVVAGTAWRLPAMAHLYAWNVENISRMHVALGHWVAEHTPPDAVLALNDIGAITYISERPVVDLAGLVTPEVVPLLRTPDQASRLAEFLAERGVQYVVIFPNWFPDLAARSDLLEPLHQVTLERNTIAGGQTMVVYRAHWRR